MVSPSSPERIGTERAMGALLNLKSQTPQRDRKWDMNHNNNDLLLMLSDASQMSSQLGDDTDSDSGDNQKGSPTDEATTKNGPKNKKPVDDVSDGEQDQSFNVEDFEEDVPKTWNLRPRKPISMNEKALMIGASSGAKKTEAKNKEKKLPKFSISLTKEEIEEDILAMTGSLPSKTPTKRPKNVQKELDSLFPGLKLESRMRNSYKVPESTKKD